MKKKYLAIGAVVAVVLALCVTWLVLAGARG